MNKDIGCLLLLVGMLFGVLMGPLAASLSEKSCLEPVDGRIGMGWNKTWEMLAQEPDTPDGIILIALLTETSAKAPHYFQINQLQSGKCEVYCSWAEKQPPGASISSSRVATRRFSIETRLAERVYGAWLAELYCTSYPKNSRIPLVEDGTTCVAGATDRSRDRFLMGKFHLPSQKGLGWMHSIAETILRYAGSLRDHKSFADAIARILDNHEALLRPGTHAKGHAKGH